jgi:hypothetical protein
MLVPMIGTWVGTLLAYYFSGDNFTKASQSVSKLVDQITTDKLKAIPVTQAMIPKTGIQLVQLPAGNDEASVNLKTGIVDRYRDPVTRLPVLDDQGRVKYIIHQSLVYKYIADKVIAGGERNTGRRQVADGGDARLPGCVHNGRWKCAQTNDRLASKHRNHQARPSVIELVRAGPVASGSICGNIGNSSPGPAAACGAERSPKTGIFSFLMPYC